MTFLALVKAGSTFLPSNATTGQQYQATKIPIPTPFSTTVPMFFPEADRPSLSTTPPFLTLSRSITDAVNIASLSENIGGPPETNSLSPCLLTYHAPCWIVRPAPSPSAPLTVSNIPPFGVYFCRKPTLTALRRDGIHPTAQSSRQGNPLNIALKLQAARHSEMSDLVYHSPLNQQRHGLYLFVNLPATLEAGFTWFMLDSQKGIVGTRKVPLPASFFHSALAIESGQPVHHWIPSPHEPTSHPPRNRPPVGAPTAEATETYLNTHSDIRLEQILRAPPVIPTGVDPSDSHPPRDSDHDTEILSQSATEAFQRLIAAIDNPPTNYIAPWLACLLLIPGPLLS